MSNILIIKHGSLGDLIQANGAIKDIKKNFPQDKVLLLTTQPYADFMSTCPYIDGVLIDKRLPRWNLFYLHSLKKILQRFSFTKVFDLQNSSRTSFYKRFLFKKDTFWSNSNYLLNRAEVSKEKKQSVVTDDFTKTKNAHVESCTKAYDRMVNGLNLTHLIHLLKRLK